MKKKYSPEEIIDYLNGLMSDSDRTDIELAMKQDESLRMEINELVLMRTKLADTSNVNPPSINPESIIRRSKKDWRKTAYQTVRYAAMFLITLIVIGSLSNINIQYDDSGMQLSMSVWPEQPPTVIETIQGERDDSVSPETIALLQEFQKQQAQLVADIIEKDRADQRQQIQELFSEYATMIENRRMIDMELIQYELDNIAQRTDTRQKQTDLVLGSLLESISLNK